MNSRWKTSPDIKKLRDAAVKEMDATPEEESSAGKIDFDHAHGRTVENDSPAEDFDRDNWVAKYPGPNVPHIGNGSGGVKGR